jgi:D-alanyl-D-alanine carboxypeptidase
MKKKFLVLFVALILLVVGAILWKQHQSTAGSKTIATTNSEKPTHAHTLAPATPQFDKHKYSVTDPASLWVIVNKQHSLTPKDYTPADLVAPDMPLRYNATSSEMHVRLAAARALATMTKAAATDNVHLKLASGYRSYATQVAVYGSEVKAYGQAQADRESARPGFSEHQSGLAADLEDTNRECEVADCFGQLPEGKWVVTNAYKYGFILRYPQDKETVTGYRYEAWHVRYVGTDLAAEMHKQGIETLEEFFGVTGGANY